MRAGCGQRSITTEFLTPTSPTRSFATAIYARSTTSSSFPASAAAPSRRSTAFRRLARIQSPTRRPKLTPNLGVEDSSDDIRGGMGIEGLAELVKFVEAGGTLITEGSTTTILPDYGITTRVSVEHPTTLYAKGALMRGIIADKMSPIVYGYTGDQMPVYFSQDPVLNTRGGGFRGAAAVPGVGVDITPNATPIALSPYEADDRITEPKGLPTQSSDAEAARQAIRQFGGAEDESAVPRVVLRVSREGRRNSALR